MKRLIKLEERRHLERKALGEGTPQSSTSASASVATSRDTSSYHSTPAPGRGEKDIRRSFSLDSDSGSIEGESSKNENCKF